MPAKFLCKIPPSLALSVSHEKWILCSTESFTCSILADFISLASFNTLLCPQLFFFFSCKLEFRPCLLVQSSNLARMAQRQCGIHPLGGILYGCPYFVEQADTGARCLQCLCHLRRLKMERFHSIYASSFIWWNSSLMRHFLIHCLVTWCYSSCATHRIRLHYLPLLTQFLQIINLFPSI